MNDIKTNVQLAKSGSTEAFTELYKTVYKELYYTALYNLRNEHDACDAVSDTVLDAFNSIKKLKDDEKFKSWIMKILFAKIKKRQKDYSNAAESIEENDTLSEDFDFENSDLKEAIDKLDNDSKAILSLSVLGGYSSEEISLIYGMNSSTVRSRLARVKEKLRISLSE